MFILTLRQLEYLVAVADTGTIAGAADLCKVSAVAVGQGLDELEKQVGTQLTHRQRAKGVELTEVGEVVLAQARQILAGVAALPTLVEHTTQQLRGKITFGVFPTLAPWIVPPVLRSFYDEYPDITVDFQELSPKELGDQLALGQIDFYLTYLKHQPQNTTLHVVAELEPFVIVSENHPFAQRASVTLQDLACEDIVLPGYTPARENISAILQEYGLMDRVKWSPKSSDTLHGIVGENLGVSLLFSFKKIVGSLRGRRIVSIPLLGTQLENSVVLCHPPNRPLGVAEQKIIELLTEESRKD